MKVLVRILQVIVALFVLLLVISFFASNDDSNKTTGEQKEEQTAQVETEAKDTQKKNDKGVYIFDSIPAYFEYTKTYDKDGGELTFIDNNPENIKITPFELSENNVLDDLNKTNFIKTIYRLFIHTNAAKITLEMYPKVVDKDGNVTKELSILSIKGTITRDKALSVLKKYSTAQSFDDLIITDKAQLPEYATLGFSTTKTFSDLINKNKNEVLGALLDKKIKDTILIKKKVPDGKFNLATVIKKINKKFGNSSLKIPTDLKPEPSDNARDVNEVALFKISEDFVLMIKINKETKRVNGLSTIIKPNMEGGELEAALTINALILSSLDTSGSSSVSKRFAEETVKGVSEFSKTKGDYSTSYELNGLKYSLSISKQLGAVFSSVSYPMSEE